MVLRLDAMAATALRLDGRCVVVAQNVLRQRWIRNDRLGLILIADDGIDRIEDGGLRFGNQIVAHISPPSSRHARLPRSAGMRGPSPMSP